MYSGGLSRILVIFGLEIFYWKIYVFQPFHFLVHQEFLVAPVDTCQSFESKATGGGGGGPTRTVAPVYDVDVETLEQKFMAMVWCRDQLHCF